MEPGCVVSSTLTSCQLLQVVRGELYVGGNWSAIALSLLFNEVVAFV